METRVVTVANCILQYRRVREFHSKTDLIDGVVYGIVELHGGKFLSSYFQSWSAFSRELLRQVQEEEETLNALTSSGNALTQAQVRYWTGPRWVKPVVVLKSKQESVFLIQFFYKGKLRKAVVPSLSLTDWEAVNEFRPTFEACIRQEPLPVFTLFGVVQKLPGLGYVLIRKNTYALIFIKDLGFYLQEMSRLGKLKSKYLKILQLIVCPIEFRKNQGVRLIVDFHHWAWPLNLTLWLSICLLFFFL